MLTARTDLVAHIPTLGLPQLVTVKPYAGEIAQAAQAGGMLLVPLPAAFVLPTGYESSAHTEVTRLDVLFVTHTAALDVDASAADAMALAEAFVDKMREVPDWSANGNRYVTNLTDGIRAETLAVALDFTIVRASLSVEAR